jgi:hypothetical protein
MISQLLLKKPGTPTTRPSNKHILDGDGNPWVSPPSSLISENKTDGIVSYAESPLAHDLPTFEDVGDHTTGDDNHGNLHDVLIAPKDVVVPFGSEVTHPPGLVDEAEGPSNKPRRRCQWPGVAINRLNHASSRQKG